MAIVPVRRCSSGAFASQLERKVASLHGVWRKNHALVMTRFFLEEKSEIIR